MKKIIMNILLVPIFFVLQTAVFGRLSVVGVIPNVLVILVAVMGFMQGDKAALIIGFFCGLLVDIFTFRILGLNALIYSTIGFVTGKFHNTFYPEDFKLPLLVVTGSDIGYSLLMYLLTYLFRSRFHFGFYFLNVCLPELAYTLLVALAIYPLFLLLYRFVIKERVKE
ncbi:MAG: rod shape-determining protein MreD [Lachnospiraceae bacterium]|nr:rod shape-determining protein MreD [Lachnospiraceae bacterium]